MGGREVDLVMRKLHEGRFASTELRWLYFLTGLLGAGMVATGSILWVEKRRRQAEKPGYPHRKGMALTQCLNVATIAGLAGAIPVYFWANRLIPADMPGRAEWEVHALFIAWGLMFVHAVARHIVRHPQRQRVWIEQLCVGAVAWALLPLVNFVTSDRHLGTSLIQGDWIMAGFNLTALAIGLCAAFAAYRISQSTVVDAPEPTEAPAARGRARRC